MACNHSNALKNIPDSQLSETEIQALLDEREATLREALTKFQEAGGQYEFCSSSQRLRLVFDGCEIFTDDDDNLRIQVDGVDIASDVQLVQIRLGRGNYPQIIVSFSPIMREKK